MNVTPHVYPSCHESDCCRELAHSRAEARAALQEAQLVTEELRTANEELQAANEELAAGEEELREANSRLQVQAAELEAVGNDLTNLLVSTDIAVLFLDPTHRVRRFTRAATGLVGLRPADIGRPLTDLRWQFDDPQLLADARAVFERLLPVEREVPAAGGRVFLRRVLPHRTRDDRIDGVVVTFHDLTAQKALEEQFRQAQKMEAIGRLAAGVAHDFNNLLTVIIGLSGDYLDPAEPGAGWREAAAEIHQAGTRAAELTAQLLAFSRQTVLRPRVLDANGLVRGVERLLRRLIGGGVQLVTDLAADAGNVRADRTQLEQALINLCVNARDAMPGGGRLTIGTRREAVPEGRADAAAGVYTVVRVSDTGGGMDEATRLRIFDPFFTTKGPGQGTGLGLAMVYGFVRQSDGFLEVDSEPGRGSAFDVYLPCVDEAVCPELEPVVAPAAGRGSETVLVAEDDAGVRAFAVAALRSAGYTVLEAADGAAAARAARAAAVVDLLLTDVILTGDSDGRGVAAAVRATHPAARVLYTSGHTGGALTGQEVAGEDVDFLPKPFGSAVLLARVRQALGRR